MLQSGKRFYEKYIKALWDAFIALIALIHPSAQIAMNVSIGAGAVVVRILITAALTSVCR